MHWEWKRFDSSDRTIGRLTGSVRQPTGLTSLRPEEFPCVILSPPHAPSPTVVTF